MNANFLEDTLSKLIQRLFLWLQNLMFNDYISYLTNNKVYFGMTYFTLRVHKSMIDKQQHGTLFMGVVDIGNMSM